MNFQATLANVAAAASSILQADGSMSISVTLSRVDADGTLQHLTQFGHYLEPAVARPLLEAAPTSDEIALGLSLQDMVTVRGLVALCTKHRFPLPELIPESLRPVLPPLPA